MIYDTNYRRLHAGIEDAANHARHALTTAAERAMRNHLDSGDRAEPKWFVARVKLSLLYGDTDFVVSLHGPYVEKYAERQALRLEGRCWLLGPFSLEEDT